MASITQTVPYYIQGINEQPDQLKKTGQVRDALNVVPDITDGLTKRPGAQYLNELKDFAINGTSVVDLNTEAAWFAIDQTDKFIGRVHTDGSFAVWSAANGNAQNVSYTANDAPGGCGCSPKYLAHTDPESIQFLTINDHTFVVNREKTPAMLPYTDCRYASTAYPDYTNPNWGHEYEAFVELTDVSYGQQYPLDIKGVNTGQTLGGGTYTRATKLSAKWLSGPGGAPRSMELNNTGDTRYTYAKTFDINPSPTPTGGTILTGTTSDQRNLRFKLSMTGMPYTHGNNTVHTIYRLEIELKHGGYGWKVGDFFDVEMGDPTGPGAGSIGYYRIFVDETMVINHKHSIGIGPVRPMPTTDTGGATVSADTILDQLKKEIEIKTNNIIVCTKIGNGLHLKRVSDFDGTCRGGSDPWNVITTEPQVMNIITHEASDVSKLPSVCKDGYIVKIVNSPEDEDDHWLKFVSDTPGNDGSGHWEETWDPCVLIDFDPCTMPHKIVRLANGVFDLQTIAYEQRKVGDNITNPIPSFVGQKINNILFFRNRLAFLSQDNVILSQAGDYYNFWVESATTVSDGDVIDIAASSSRPTVLYDGCESVEGLVVFSPFEQFIVTTEEAGFTPTSARIQYLSGYDYNIGIKPFALGTSVGFTSNSGLQSRFWQLANISRSQPPVIVEQSKPIANSLPTNLLTAAHSRDNNICLFTGWDPVPGTSYGSCLDPYSNIWGYRYFSDGQKLIQSAWFRWQFYGKVVWHTIMANTYYVVIYYNSQAHFLALDLEKQTATYILNDTNVCEDYPLHLDNSINLATGTYSAATGLTTFTLPTNHYRQPATHSSTSGGQQVVYGKTGAKKGEVDVVPAFTANAVSSFTLTGDWSSTAATIGFTYDMEVEFPHVYLFKPAGDINVADLTADLNIHRVTFNFGPSGYYSTILQRKGRADYTQDFESSNTHTFNLNQYNILLDSTTTVPIYSRNKDFRVKLLSTHPTPCTLYSQTWEGDYNPNYYQRG